ncbi:hypothetical protein [Amycolatopsis sp. NPDC051903]|uniref:hypothetical protein n=1 Tax=Amycolatopsis sp. NPDC051903 TaxID=3363936 RepID=UPI0037B7ABF0
MAELKTMPMTSADGACEHLIDVTAGLPQAAEFTTLCRAEIRPAAMTVAPGRPCAACWQHVVAARARATAPLYVLIPQQGRGHGGRHRRPARPGWLHTRLTSALGGVR